VDSITAEPGITEPEAIEPEAGQGGEGRTPRLALDGFSGKLEWLLALVLALARTRQVNPSQMSMLLRNDNTASLVFKRRGRPNNRRMPDEVRQLALALVRVRYFDFGPTLAAEKLAELHARRTNPGGDATAWASWCRSTARNTLGSRTAGPPARC